MLLTNIINISKSESIINLTIELENNPISSFTFQDKNHLKILISHKPIDYTEVNIHLIHLSRNSIFLIIFFSQYLFLSIEVYCR
jgi:hypothetical protein